MNHDRQNVAPTADKVVLTVDDISAEEVRVSKPAVVMADQIEDAGNNADEQNFQNN